MPKGIYYKLNWAIMLPPLGLSLIGITAIWSLSSFPSLKGVSSLTDKITILLTFQPIKQMLFLLLGISLMIGLFSITYYKLKDYSYLLYGLVLGVLIILVVWGRITHGARRWIPLGPFTLQPSEFMKVVLVLALARLLMYKRNITQGRDLILALLLTLCPIGLVLLQPNLGTALVFLPCFWVMLWVAGARLRNLAIIIILFLISSPLIYFGVMQDYQKRRLQAFINPFQVPMAEGFQAIQSKIAVGSGGLIGRGWGETESNTSLFVPEKRNDFIFTTISEEWGFLGSSVVLGLYLLFFTSAFLMAYQVRESYGRLLIVGLITYLAVQTLINIGMTIGLVPVTGITLPFVSYGGSSLISSYLAVGLIINIGLNPIPTFAGGDFE